MDEIIGEWIQQIGADLPQEKRNTASSALDDSRERACLAAEVVPGKK
jgi:hypothetical protein